MTRDQSETTDMADAVGIAFAGAGSQTFRAMQARVAA